MQPVHWIILVILLVLVAVGVVCAIYLIPSAPTPTPTPKVRRRPGDRVVIPKKKPVEPIVPTEPEISSETPWVTVNLMGGLGNQLFQSATAFAYGQQHGHKFQLPRPPVISPDTEAPRDPYWTTFLAWVPEMEALPEPEVVQEDAPPFVRVGEPLNMYYQEPRQELNTNVQLRGYFQSPRYFQAYAQEWADQILSHIFVPPPQCIIPHVQVWISVHIRRGDYVGHPWLPVQPWSYYEKALKLLTREESLGAVGILWFSDDPQWVKDHRPENTFVNVVVDEGREIEQLYWMARCADMHVIANSSFSWWGAYLSPFARKGSDRKHVPRVVAPKHWFNQGPEIPEINWQSIYPDDWLRL